MNERENPYVVELNIVREDNGFIVTFETDGDDNFRCEEEFASTLEEAKQIAVRLLMS